MPTHIVVLGGGDVDSTRHFVRGLLVGVAVSVGLVVIMAPGRANVDLLEEAARQRQVAEAANERARQAATVAGVCVQTAQDLQHTLTRYQELLAE